MEFRLIILFLAIMCAGGGCKTFPVSGNIDFSGSTLQRTLYLIEVKSFSSLASSFEGKVLDSAQFDVKGNFFFQNMPDKEGQNIYLLALQKPGEKFLTRLENENPLASNYLPFLYCPGDKVIIFSKALSMLKEVTIKSKIPENIVLQNLSRKRVEWYQQYFLENKSADEESHIENEASKLNYQKVILNFVKEEKNIYVHSMALRWASPAGDYERLADEVREVCTKLKVYDPEHPWTNQICVKSTSLPPVTGDVFPHIFFPTSDYDSISIKKLLATKLTLVDLWASWCAPCRKENKQVLVPLWDQFHKKGFEIIGYALDSSEKGWKAAILNDGADRWKHFSHLKGDESPVFETIHMTMIPANFLLDSRGVIVAKNLHGESLKKFVEDYFRS